MLTTFRSLTTPTVNKFVRDPNNTTATGFKGLLNELYFVAWFKEDVQFVQTECKRGTLYQVLYAFGGFISTGLPIMQYFIAGIESFQEDSSVIKKLYSSRQTSKKQRKLDRFNKKEKSLDAIEGKS
jgi:hypothetical protein